MAATTQPTTKIEQVWSDRLDEWVTAKSPINTPATDAGRPGKYAIKCGHCFARLVGRGPAWSLANTAGDATAFDSEDDVLEAFDGVVEYLKTRKLNSTIAKGVKFDIVEL